VALQNSLRVIKKFCDQRSLELLESLRLEAKVEPGTHLAEVVVRMHGGSRRENLVVR
jgi:hypothetical protein